MLTLAIKILIAIFACLVAVLSVSDLKSVAEADPDQPKPWWRRLTTRGKIKIACAVFTLCLIGANESLSYSGATAAALKASAQETALTSQLKASEGKLDEAKDALGASFVQLSRLSRTNDFLVRTLDQSVVRAGVARILIANFKSAYIPMDFEGAGPVSPKNGDILEWSFVCHSGALPPATTCANGSFGRLIANSYPIPLTEKAGRETFFGTRSTGGVLEYRTPAEDGQCPDLAEAMKTAKCELRLAVWREARWQFKELQAGFDGSKPLAASSAAQDACRKYEALYGESCDEAVRRLVE